MGSVAIFLLRLPLLQMAAGVVLLGIAVRLTLIDGAGLERDADEAPPAQARALLAAVWCLFCAAGVKYRNGSDDSTHDFPRRTLS